MASITNIQLYGNQLAIMFADGTKQLAYPTVGNMWIVSGGGGGTDPGEDDLFSWPYALDWVSDEFGLREDVGRWHEGIDMAGGPASYGNPIPCIGDGVVEFAGENGAFGMQTIVDHGVLATGSRAGQQIHSSYAHQPSLPPVVFGQPVVRGDWIGYINNSGSSFGSHLHMEIHATPPGGPMIGDYTNPNPAPPSNRTAIDPREFMLEYNPSGGWLI